MDEMPPVRTGNPECSTNRVLLARGHNCILVGTSDMIWLVFATVPA